MKSRVLRVLASLWTSRDLAFSVTFQTHDPPDSGKANENIALIPQCSCWLGLYFSFTSAEYVAYFISEAVSKHLSIYVSIYLGVKHKPLFSCSVQHDGQWSNLPATLTRHSQMFSKAGILSLTHLILRAPLRTSYRSAACAGSWKLSRLH